MASRKTIIILLGLLGALSLLSYAIVFFVGTNYPSAEVVQADDVIPAIAPDTMEEPWRNVYAQILKDLSQNPLPSPWYEQSVYRPMYLAFFIHDINGSGTPELFITIGTHYRELMKVFTFSNDAAMPLTIPSGYIFGDQFYLPPDNGLGIISWGFHAIGSFWYAHLVMGEGKLIAEVELAREIGACTDTGMEVTSYLINREEVTEARFDDMFRSIVGDWVVQHEITEENIQNVIFGCI